MPPHLFGCGSAALWFVFSVPSVSCPMWGRLSSLRPAFQPALAPFTHRPLLNPMPCPVGADQRVRPFSSDLGALPCSRKGAVPRGASRQACHAGGHAGRATQCRAVREPQRHPARTTARSTSTRPLSPHLRVLRVLRGLLFLRALRVVSDVRPAFQQALAPFTHRPPSPNRRRQVEHAARLAMPAALWSPQSCGPRRQSWRRLASDLPPLLQWGSLFCGAGFPACGRLSSRPWPPLPTALLHPIAAPSVEQAARLAMPAVTPAEPHNPERYGSPDAIRPARLRAPPQPAPSLPISVSSVSSVVCFSPCPPCPPWFAFSPCPPCRVRCAAGFPAGLGPFYPPPSFTQSPPPSGASRQACHAGGHAGRATQSRAVQEPRRHPARTTARSTSTRRLSPHLRILRVLRGLFFSVSSVSSVVCFFSVPSVSCPMCGRLSSRPWPLLPTALFHPPCTPVLSSPYEHFAIDAPLNRKISCDPFSRQ